MHTRVRNWGAASLLVLAQSLTTLYPNYLPGLWHLKVFGWRLAGCGQPSPATPVGPLHSGLSDRRLAMPRLSDPRESWAMAAARFRTSPWEPSIVMSTGPHWVHWSACPVSRRPLLASRRGGSCHNGSEHVPTYSELILRWRRQITS